MSASPPFRFRELQSRVTRMFAARLVGVQPMVARACLAATVSGGGVASACLTVLYPSTWPIKYSYPNRVTAWGVALQQITTVVRREWLRREGLSLVLER